MNRKSEFATLLAVIVLFGMAGCEGGSSSAGSGDGLGSGYPNPGSPDTSGTDFEPEPVDEEATPEDPITSLPPMPGTGVPKTPLSFEPAGELPFAGSSQDVACFNDQIYVLNQPAIGSSQNTIYVFDGPDDATPAAIGDWGSDPGQFYAPKRLTIDKSGKIYVADVGDILVDGDDRITIVDPNNGWQTTEISNLPYAYAVAVDDSGLIYAADNSLNRNTSEKHSRILLIDGSTHNIVGSMGYLDARYLSGLHIRDGFLYAVDSLDGGAVRVYDLSSQSLVFTIRNADLQKELWNDENLYSVEDVFVDIEGRIFWDNSALSTGIYYIDDVLDDFPARINSSPGSIDEIRGGGLVICGDYLYVAMGAHVPPLGVKVYKINK